MSRYSSSSNQLFIGLLLSMALLLLVLGGVLLGYSRIATTLPEPNELRDRANTFKTTTIYDREGNLLYEIFPNDTGRRTVVPLASIGHHLINATLAVEDPNFYHHPGVDPVGVARAVYYALQQDERVPGGSGIPQQLVKLTFLSADKTLSRKLKEAVLAIEISRRYGKDEILEIYLNHITYGNLAFGAEAAAQTYFEKPASQLSLAEASLIAGLTQAPGLYNPYQNWERARDRQADVLRLMVEHDFITAGEATDAWLEWEDLSLDDSLAASGPGFSHPHFVLMIRQQLEQTYGADVVSKGGFHVTTTLDPRLQQFAERSVQDGMMALSQVNADAGNAALVTIAPESGEILALVGSPDFNNVEINGQVNMALAPRQTGSVIKPLTYLATFEMAEDFWTPATMVVDKKIEFPDGSGQPPYIPKNYDGKFHGPVSVRSALANSYNIPAVKALQHAGVPALQKLASRLGITSLTRPDYGLSLTLGGGEVSLLEMTAAFAVFANNGERIEPHAILTVETEGGDLLEDNRDKSGPLVVSPAHAYLLTSMLSDKNARRPAFGSTSRTLELPDRPVAAKTGTTDDWRDGWTVGYTPQLVTGVWVGNTDNREMNELSGVRSAAPIWQQFMQLAHDGLPVQPFSRPAGVIEREVCQDTGFLAHPECERRRQELFKADQLPPEVTPTPVPTPAS